MSSLIPKGIREGTGEQRTSAVNRVHSSQCIFLVNVVGQNVVTLGSNRKAEVTVESIL